MVCCRMLLKISKYLPFLGTIDRRSVRYVFMRYFANDFCTIYAKIIILSGQNVNVNKDIPPCRSRSCMSLMPGSAHDRSSIF